MMGEPDLFSPRQDSFWNRSRPLRERAQEWIQTHPDVMALFEKSALEMLAAGQPFGIALLTEHIRWECKLKRLEGEEWKLNNSYRAYIARELLARHPVLGKFLEIRKTATGA